MLLLEDLCFFVGEKCNDEEVDCRFLSLFVDDEDLFDIPATAASVAVDPEVRTLFLFSLILVSDDKR